MELLQRGIRFYLLSKEPLKIFSRTVQREGQDISKWTQHYLGPSGGCQLRSWQKFESPARGWHYGALDITPLHHNAQHSSELVPSVLVEGCKRCLTLVLVS